MAISCLSVRSFSFVCPFVGRLQRVLLLAGDCCVVHSDLFLSHCSLLVTFLCKQNFTVMITNYHIQNKVMRSITYLPRRARVPRFAVSDSGAQGEVCCIWQRRACTMPYSIYLPNLKSAASSIPEILKEFTICRQTDRHADRYRS